MQVAGVDVGVEGGQVQVDLAGGVRAVDDGEDAVRPRPCAEFGHGQDLRSGRGDVAQVDDARGRRDALPQLVDDGGGVGDGQGERPAYVARAAPGARRFPGVGARAIFMVGRQHLVAGLEVERARHDIDGKGGVVDEDEIFGAGVEVGSQVLPRGAQGRRGLAAEEAHGLALQPSLPLLVDREDRERRRAEGTVVEEGDVGVELEVGT